MPELHGIAPSSIYTCVMSVRSSALIRLPPPPPSKVETVSCKGIFLKDADLRRREGRGRGGAGRDGAGRGGAGRGGQGREGREGEDERQFTENVTSEKEMRKDEHMKKGIAE